MRSQWLCLVVAGSSAATKIPDAMTVVTAFAIDFAIAFAIAFASAAAVTAAGLPLRLLLFYPVPRNGAFRQVLLPRISQ